MQPTDRSLLVLALGWAAAGAAAQGAELKPSFLISSPSYTEFAFLDARNAAAERDCGGRNLSPALAWSGEPADTKSFAVVYFDPDGNNGQGEAHWIGYNIPTGVHGIPEGGMGASVANMTVGTNDHGNAVYYGACPPYGKFHHYVYGVYALDLPVGELQPGLNRDELLRRIKGHTRAYQSIVFVYQRTPPPAGTQQRSPQP